MKQIIFAVALLMILGGNTWAQTHSKGNETHQPSNAKTKGFVKAYDKIQVNSKKATTTPPGAQSATPPPNDTSRTDRNGVRGAWKPGTTN